ncbi:MAG: glycosyltransferase family protein [bacterium]
MNNKKKILYGICGIGNGHMQRQLPIIQHLAKTNRIAIFAYGSSFQTSNILFGGDINIKVLEVAVPFYVGNKTGIDFKATKKLEKNNIDFDAINNKAIIEMIAWLGIPDLVVSDYEPVSAGIAYEHAVPLVTIDQQSKYLIGDFPETLNNCTYADEVARLQLFFPTAVERIACSFFKVSKKGKEGMNVLVVPAIIKESVVHLKRSTNSKQKNILVYLTSNQDIKQSHESIVSVFKKFPDVVFHVFAQSIPQTQLPVNVYWNKYNDEEFMKVLVLVNGIITTAGHTLIAEAMYLEIPVYAIPLPIYEQQMNAHIIEENNFGVMHDAIDSETFKLFLENLDKYTNNIVADTTALCKGNGLETVINKLENTK